MTQNLGDEKVLAIPALSASYEKLPNALARARNEKVACSSQVTSSRKEPRNRYGSGAFAIFSELLRKMDFRELGQCLPNVYRIQKFFHACFAIMFSMVAAAVLSASSKLWA